MNQKEYIDLLESTIDSAYKKAHSDGDINMCRVLSSALHSILVKNPGKIRMARDKAKSPAEELLDLKEIMSRINHISSIPIL